MDKSLARLFHHRTGVRQFRADLTADERQFSEVSVIEVARLTADVQEVVSRDRNDDPSANEHEEPQTVE